MQLLWATMFEEIAATSLVRNEWSDEFAMAQDLPTDNPYLPPREEGPGPARQPDQPPEHEFACEKPGKKDESWQLQLFADRIRVVGPQQTCQVVREEAGKKLRLTKLKEGCLLQVPLNRVTVKISDEQGLVLVAWLGEEDAARTMMQLNSLLLLGVLVLLAECITLIVPPEPGEPLPSPSWWGLGLGLFSITVGAMAWLRPSRSTLLLYALWLGLIMASNTWYATFGDGSRWMLLLTLVIASSFVSTLRQHRFLGSSASADNTP